jgi:lipoic acid synthetase
MTDQTPSSSKKTHVLRILPSHEESIAEDRVVGKGRFPSWLHRPLPKGGKLQQTESVIQQYRLHTVCEEAKCPNLFECWSRKTATFLIMGKECTRNCGFCTIDFAAQPKPLDLEEPMRVAESVRILGLRHVVITMVARDDLSDGGSAHLQQVMDVVREVNACVTLEVLTSDFQGNIHAWQNIFEAAPTIFNHNIETVRELTPRVRHKATYERSLAFLEYIAKQRMEKNKTIKIKSGLMLGLGEEKEQVYQSLRDLKAVGCDIVTIGQYLQPHHRKLRIKNFISPNEFKEYEKFGYEIGFSYMYCGPFVRSSYNADACLSFLQ